MIYNSYIFVFLFLPISLFSYFFINRFNEFLGKIFLILCGAVFYIYDNSAFYYLFISITVNYIFGSFIYKNKDKRLLIGALFFNVLFLLFFKYVNLFRFLEFNISLPLGISFYTFQQISYLFSVYRNDNENNIFDYLAYILFFPKLIMGPLIEPEQFIKQINDSDKKKIDLVNIASGIKLFSLGLFKKAFFADIFALAYTRIYENISTATGMDLIVMMLFYSFQLYFDFSGYSDMSIGIASLFNIELPMNFDSPYKSFSIQEFWRRWHISLSDFLTKYIYIPLGGSKKGELKTYLNILIVFIVSGIWHGSKWTFVLWGLLNGLCVVFDRYISKRNIRIFKPLRWLVTFIVVNILWLLFSSQSISEWLFILHRIIFVSHQYISKLSYTILNNTELIQYMKYLSLFKYIKRIKGYSVLIYLGMSFVICLLFENNYRNKDKFSRLMAIIAGIAFVYGVLSLGKESVFVYYGF